MWYGGPGQHENLRDVEAGLLREDFVIGQLFVEKIQTKNSKYWLREDSGEKEEEDMEEVYNEHDGDDDDDDDDDEQVEADRMALLSIERNIANMERR